jgi:tetratricopeptide (TPR) repeat protein
MRRRSLSRIAGLFLLLAMSTAAWPQGGATSGTIIGIARVFPGTFPEPVLVTLQLRGAAMATAYTDPEGRFSFGNLGGSVYHVVINDERYVPIDIEVTVRPDVLTVNMLQLTLIGREPKADPKAPGGSYVTSPSDLTKAYPKNAIKEFERGVKMESAGKEDQAIEHYRKAIQEAPDFAVAHNNLGSLYVGKSDFPAAQREFADSIRLSPSDSKAYFNMANVMLLTGKLQDAERYLQDGFRKQPDSAFGFFVQGSVLERNGNLPDAERALRRSLELNPKMTRPHLELVNLYLREQRPADAIAELHKFLQEAPSDALAPKARDVLKKLESGNPSH